jgi:hypothetical protein
MAEELVPESSGTQHQLPDRGLCPWWPKSRRSDLGETNQDLDVIDLGDALRDGIIELTTPSSTDRIKPHRRWPSDTKRWQRHVWVQL